MRLNLLTISVGLLLAACAAAPQPTPSPLPAPTLSPTGTPLATASASPTLVPTASPTTSPTAGPTASLTPTASTAPTPTPTSAPAGWVEVSGFPTYGARTYVESIDFANGTFVAVGWSYRNSTDRGRVWTSADGITWTAQPDAAFAGHPLLAVAHNDSDFYAFASAPASVWRSADGSSWQEVDLPVEGGGELGTWNAFSGGRVADAFGAGGMMYAAGEAGVTNGDIECGCAAVWRSSNGTDWQQSTVSPPQDFEDVAVLAGPPAVVVGIGSDPYFGQGVRFTTDFETWTKPDIDLEGTGYLDAASDGQRIVAVGYSGDEFEEAIAVVTDGSTWTTSHIEDAAGPAEQLTWAGGRFVAVGRQTWSSIDGLSWVRGPLVPYPPPDPVPPEAGDDPFTHRTIGGGTPGVVLAQTYDEGLHVWFAPPIVFGVAPAGL